jgi:hypothetical protein
LFCWCYFRSICNSIVFRCIRWSPSLVALPVFSGIKCFVSDFCS